MKITLKKFDFKEIEALQTELENYKIQIVISTKQNLYDVLIQTDILNKLYYSLRDKLETGKPIQNISLKLSEAGVIMKALQNPGLNNCPYHANVLLKVRNSIDEQLKNLI